LVVYVLLDASKARSNSSSPKNSVLCLGSHRPAILF
jgi:hypothetical protein